MTETLETRLGVLEGRLRPIAERRIDFSSLRDIRVERSPLDRAGVRVQAAAVVRELIDQYEAASPAERIRLRALLAAHPAFAWAAEPGTASATAEGFHTVMVWLSLLDQARDPRDVLVTLAHECATARAAGVDVARVLTEVAAMSSEVDRFGFGSTRGLLLSAIS
jgi:hypothetical protein